MSVSRNMSERPSPQSVSRSLLRATGAAAAASAVVFAATVPSLASQVSLGMHMVASNVCREVSCLNGFNARIVRARSA